MNAPSSSPSVPQRLHVLDALRGVAALAVVFWHWQHFFYVGSSPNGFVTEHQPFFDAFAWLYRHGSRAVELFFCLSGYVFHWLYAKDVAARRLGAGKYFLWRFSRLYPLHLVTFVAVALGQLAYRAMSGRDFVYPWNDAYHAFLNLLLAPAWGLERGFSFNGPVWSVSVEVLLYAVFFAGCRSIRRPWIPAVLAIAAGTWLMAPLPKVGIGLVSFFAGGLAHELLAGIEARRGRRWVFALATVTAVASWAFVVGRPGDPTLLLSALAFPSTIVFLVTTEDWTRGLASRLTFLGDASYASYLLHFPLQLCAVLVTDGLGLPRTIYESRGALVLFFGVLILGSVACHRMFELPAQARLRRWRRPDGVRA